MTIPEKLEQKHQLESLLDNYDNFLFDCDGVVWLDEHLIPGMLETINFLRSKGKKVVFITNNSSKSREDYIHKFKRLGFEGITKDIIYPTCYAAVIHLKIHLKVPIGSKVWVLGDHGIENELREEGYIPLGGSNPQLDTDFDETSDFVKVDPEVKAVIVGSTKKFNYMRIASTLQYLLHENKSLTFIGTNIDRTYPGPNGMILPAGGSVVNYMSYTADRECIDVGKPSTLFLNTVVETQNLDKDRTIMIGDTLYTDIKFGNDGKLGGGNGSTILVLTGGSKLKDLENITDDSMRPSFIMESFGHFIKHFQ